MGSQCGHCTPGMIMSGVALLQQNPRPTADEVRMALSGNLCRCGNYRNEIAAGALTPRRATETRGAQIVESSEGVIGAGLRSTIPALDARAKRPVRRASPATSASLATGNCAASSTPKSSARLTRWRTSWRSTTAPPDRCPDTAAWSRSATSAATRGSTRPASGPGQKRSTVHERPRALCRRRDRGRCCRRRIHRAAGAGSDSRVVRRAGAVSRRRAQPTEGCVPFTTAPLPGLPVRSRRTCRPSSTSAAISSRAWPRPT